MTLTTDRHLVEAGEQLARRSMTAAARQARRTYLALRAATELPAARRYDETLGRASYSRADLQAMMADPHCPESKRRVRG